MWACAHLHTLISAHARMLPEHVMLELQVPRAHIWPIPLAESHFPSTHTRTTRARAST